MTTQNKKQVIKTKKEEKKNGFGNKKIEGPNRPST